MVNSNKVLEAKHGYESEEEKAEASSKRYGYQ